MSDDEHVKELMESGRHLAFEGRLEEAEAALREALRLTRGVGSAAESRACGNLGTFYGIHGRNFEALLLYRRALAIDRGRGDWRLVVLHLANMASIYCQLDLHSRLRDLIREMDEALGRLGEEAPPYPATRDRSLYARFEAACWLSDLDGARRWLDAIDQAPRVDVDPRLEAMIHYLRAELCQKAGEPKAAVQAIDEGLAVPGVPLSAQLDLLAARVRVLEKAGDAEAVLRGAADALERLEAVRSDPHLTENAIQCGGVLAGAVERAGGPPELARRAYDVAASATLERIRQLDALMRDLPELSTATREDYTWFATLRAGFAHEQKALLDRVAALLEAARHEGRSPFYEREEEGLIRLCAWCSRVRTREDHWIPVAHFIPQEPNVRVTHSICPSCVTRLRRQQRPGRDPVPGRATDAE